VTETELAWLVGILEGEGYFSWHGNKRYYGTPQIALMMCDRDVVERVAQLMRVTSAIEEIGKKKSHWKTSFRCSVSGNPAADLMRKLLPHMGERRAAKIKELLFLWDTRPALAAKQRARAKAQKAKWARVIKGKSTRRRAPSSPARLSRSQLRNVSLTPSLSRWERGSWVADAGLY